MAEQSKLTNWGVQVQDSFHSLTLSLSLSCDFVMDESSPKYVFKEQQSSATSSYIDRKGSKLQIHEFHPPHLFRPSDSCLEADDNIADKIASANPYLLNTHDLWSTVKFTFTFTTSNFVRSIHIVDATFRVIILTT